MAWSSCGRILVSGGADGIIHAFSLVDMVATGSNDSSVQSFRSFSHHQLPITALKALPGGRIVSGAQDGQLTIMELFSEQILAAIQLPHPVTSLDATAHRLFVGTQQGTIYSIDIDQYALHQTQQQGAIIVSRGMSESDKSISDRVFQTSESLTEDLSVAYQVELRGHDRAVTALAVISDFEEEWLVSGDQAGVVRVWDMASRASIRTIHLWSSQNKQASSLPKGTTSVGGLHAVATITVLDEHLDNDKGSDSILSHTHQQNHSGRNQASRNPHSIVAQIKALQRFTDDAALIGPVTIRLSLPKRMFWHDTCETGAFDIGAALQKRLKRRAGSSDDGMNKDAEIERLKFELATAKKALEQQSAT